MTKIITNILTKVGLTLIELRPNWKWSGNYFPWILNSNWMARLNTINIPFFFVGYVRNGSSGNSRQYENKWLVRRYYWGKAIAIRCQSWISRSVLWGDLRFYPHSHINFRVTAVDISGGFLGVRGNNLWVPTRFRCDIAIMMSAMFESNLLPTIHVVVCEAFARERELHRCFGLCYVLDCFTLQAI